QSGQTKVAGWHLKPGAIALFQNDCQLPLIDPTVAAYVSAFNEHLFPILLVLGLATRFAALALLLMTAVIEIFVYPGAWPTQHSEAPGLGSLPDMECGPRVSYCCSRGGRAQCRSTIGSRAVTRRHRQRRFLIRRQTLHSCQPRRRALTPQHLRSTPEVRVLCCRGCGRDHEVARICIS